MDRSEIGFTRFRTSECASRINPTCGVTPVPLEAQSKPTEKKCSDATRAVCWDGLRCSGTSKQGAPGLCRSDKECLQSYCHQDFRIFLRAVAQRNRVAGIPSRSSCRMRPRGLGAQMIIDLDSWELATRTGGWVAAPHVRNIMTRCHIPAVTAKAAQRAPERG